MAANPSIEWTDRTWNPVNGTVKTHEDTLSDPLGWKKPQRVFVNSMSDLFHPGVPFEFIDQVFAVMALCPQHTFQVLTKRPERMAEYFNAKPHGEDGWGVGAGQLRVEELLEDWQRGGCDWLNDLPVWDESRGLLPLANYAGKTPWPLPNVWLGTSVENQEAADSRIPHLLKCPAAVRFLSCEPLLGPVDIAKFGDYADCPKCGRFGQGQHSIGGVFCPCGCACPRLNGLGWVIAGGESGSQARPMHPDWVRGIRDQCAAAGVPFFFKQWGAWAPYRPEFDRTAEHTAAWPDATIGGGNATQNGGTGRSLQRVGKKAAGRTLDGVTHDAFPEVAHA